MKQVEKSVTLSPFYQRLFFGAVLLSWVASAGLLLWMYTRHGMYLSRGTWTFQITTWVFPVLLFVLSVLFAARRYRDWTQRIFLGTLLATVAMSGYSCLQVVEGYWYNTYYSRAHPLGDGASYWAVFGNEWLVMLVSLVLYMGLLLWLRRRKDT